jgi:hypothetical protein
VGGVIVVVFFERLRVVGVSVSIAGVIGLVTLLPQVRTWIDSRANRLSAPIEPN